MLQPHAVNALRPHRRRPSAEAVAALREAASALDVEEILDLCFAFSKDPERLLVYLDVLRSKGGQKAQAAACLICFDLARQGERRFESEFLALVPVMQGFMGGGETGSRPIDRLLGGSAYLHELWSDLEQRLVGMDPRYDQGSAEEVVDLDVDVLEIELLDAEDLLEIDLDELDVVVSDEQHLRDRWHDALERFYGVDAGIRAMMQLEGTAVSVHGFFAESKADVARVEGLREQALSFADGVSEAAEMLPLIDLFLAGHTRAKNLFGRKSKARDASLRAALERFAALPRPPDTGAWLVPPTSHPRSWEKVGEILLDYIAFLGTIDAGAVERESLSPAGLASMYVDADRPQPPPPRLAPEDGPRRRR